VPIQALGSVALWSGNIVNSGGCRKHW